MVNGSVIRDFYVTVWQAVPELVLGMNDDPGLIRASNALAPIHTSLQRAVTNMGAPGILVAYQGFTRGRRRTFEITVHKIAAYIQAASLNDDDHIEFGRLMIDSIPDGYDLPVRYLQADDGCDPMDMPVLDRVGAAKLDIDIWKLSFTIAENAG